MINLLDKTQLKAAKSACAAQLSLTFNGLELQVLADNQAVLDALASYYSGLCEDRGGSARQRVYLLDRQPDIRSTEWTPINRKKASPLGLKEAFCDTPDGRWIHKVRTGLVMFQALNDPMVVGDLLANPSQVVNFINNQFLNHYQRQGYLLGHASAFDTDGTTTAIAASSGGGKSTLMLHALETETARFLSNDRILFRPEQGQVSVLGVPKHPRVNPGTLINSERLVSILPEDQQARFRDMPTTKLWQVEQKYDVLIPEAYGENRVSLAGTLKNLILLDWSLDSTASTELTPVDIHSHPEALEGLRKSPGPFFQNADGGFPPEQAAPARTYADFLQGVQVLRLTGKVDFHQAIALLQTRGIV